MEDASPQDPRDEHRQSGSDRGDDRIFRVSSRPLAGSARPAPRSSSIGTARDESDHGVSAGTAGTVGVASAQKDSKEATTHFLQTSVTRRGIQRALRT